VEFLDDCAINDDANCPSSYCWDGTDTQRPLMRMMMLIVQVRAVGTEMTHRHL